MIQRIQTLYLFIVAGLMLAMLFLPLGYIVVDKAIQILNTFGLYTLEKPSVQVTPWALYYLPICTATLAFFTIFFYKRRRLQLNICYLTLFSIVLFYVFLFMYTYVPGQKYGTNIEFQIASVIPVISGIMEVFAIRGIRKDEKLVRSLDRLR